MSAPLANTKYDNAVKADGQEAGAFIIQNSWGAEWGDGGFAFLPYRYVEEGLATDIWVGVIRNPPATLTRQNGPGV